MRPGTAVDLAVDSSNVHFFDPETGLAIGPGSRAGKEVGAAAGRG
jgi:hypothetical protein